MRWIWGGQQKRFSKSWTFHFSAFPGKNGLENEKLNF